MNLVGACLCDEVNYGSARSAVFCRGGVGECGHTLIGIGDLNVEGLAADADIVDVLTIHHEVVGTRTRSVDLDLIEVAADTADSEVLIDNLHTGHGLQ